MKSYFATLFFALIAIMGHAQAVAEIDESQEEASPHRARISSRNSDSLVPQVTIEKIDGVYRLKDNSMAVRIDSLWLKELYDNSLYDTITQTIAGLNYEGVKYSELPTSVLKERLARLNQKTPFNVEYNPELESVIKNFLKNKRKFLERTMLKSAYYFPMFEEELDNYDIPLEIKYLAIIESALNPRAKSRVGATGIWQFMYGTGKMYGLEVNSYIDERSDPLKSTEAACKYLAKLYEIFGDWDLALAAYNSGPGNVSKAIRRSGGYQNYWNLRPFLPRETAGYVPSFLAMMYIFEYAGEHGFAAQRPEVAHFETDTVHVKRPVTFDQISELVSVDVDQIQFLNPSYKLDIVPYIEGEAHALRLPGKAIGKFVTNEDAIYAHIKAEEAKKEKPLPQFFKKNSRITYRVRRGDYLGRIANRYGVRVSDLKRWNGLRNNKLRIGQRLTIYSRGSGVARTSSKSAVSPSKKVYTVQKGDSLWTISQKFRGISVKNIRDWNDISGDRLKPGMKLKLCSC
ncbi:LysM peptidoglycan-binding domain-containing protein [Sinomicrobium weinanense]|uniref:LysM peptidoglycan-binding domain-containing protein n=1 Tax=Sinomicrobium weinanense TaxID=2842200 RepID=A0A926JTM4_9FLAO|nr:LysM peptidoglycan-binding domain-containing protein [Sinomicrobium weinanense]MBC9797293.1 LysM peptidoglycan-binding domain-containing protein [Sinomicrobium weinanense]MBU3125426.1 LysM peptidoglycan-binding domain-containing protein [Sinomicrobium weinanense]